MKEILINIGLNNNTAGTLNKGSEESDIAIHVAEYFNSQSDYKLLWYEVLDSVYDGDPERCFVAKLSHSYANNSKVLHDFEIIAEMMGQDSIAISSDSMECLAFGITAKKNMKFEREYFKGEAAIRKVYRFGN